MHAHVISRNEKKSRVHVIFRMCTSLLKKKTCARHFFFLDASKSVIKKPKTCAHVIFWCTGRNCYKLENSLSCCLQYNFWTLSATLILLAVTPIVFCLSCIMYTSEYNMYSLSHLEWHSIFRSNFNRMGFFSTERFKRDVKNSIIEFWDWRNDTPNAYVRHDSDSFIWVTWLIHMFDMTHSHVWHDSFIRVTWLIHV